MPPRTLVVGAGAIGGYVAARLTAAGWPVWVVARGATREALRDRPMRVTDGGVEGEVRLRIVGDPAEAGVVDLALMCVKSFDTEAAARALRPALLKGRWCCRSRTAWGTRR